MHILGPILAGYLLFVLQATLAPALAWGPSVPNLLLLGAVTAAANRDGSAGLLFAAGLGLLADCLAPTGLGVDLMLFTGAALLLQRVRFQGRLRTVGLGILSLIAILGVTCGDVAVRAWQAGRIGDLAACGELALGTAASSALVLICCVWPWRLLFRAGGRTNSVHANDTFQNRWKMLTQ
jgi:rod shape-determining protein MreD